MQYTFFAYFFVILHTFTSLAMTNCSDERFFNNAALMNITRRSCQFCVENDQRWQQRRWDCCWCCGWKQPEIFM